MDIIHLLPDSVANRIAAGEVIQRPASCLKELVENSLDAKATCIRIVVRDAGRTLFQVIDDGIGMSATDARMAFERHATSKIKEAADLYSLRTMGFRGEALASICAVAHVTLTTRRQEDEVGTLLEIAGSEILNEEQCQCPIGTNIQIKNLFFNIPVRRKFLKTDQTELRNLLNEFFRIVLVYPKVQFTFIHNDETLYELPAGTEKQRIEAIYGKGTNRSYTSGLVPLHTDTDLVSIRGFVSKPENSTKSAQQYFFVNGRFMRHPYFLKAVQTAYAGMLAADHQPSFFIYFDISPENIDVNVHPAKTEIKFADEQTVFRILLASVREALGKFSLAPTIDFENDNLLDLPAPSNSTPAPPRIVLDPTYNPFKTRSNYLQQGHTQTTRGWEKLYPTYIPDVAPLPNDSLHDEQCTHEEVMITPPNAQELSQVPNIEETAASTIPLFQTDWQATPIWQYDDKYIFAPTPTGLLIVNQHRAHACVLYKQYREQLQSASTAVQPLLFPEILSLEQDEVPIIDTLREQLKTIGFEIQPVDRNNYSINAVPARLGNQSATETLRHILHMVIETGADAQEEWQHAIALTMAYDTAIPYGKTLSEQEIRDLLTRLFALPSFQHTPDGKQVITLWTNDEIDKRF